MRLLVGMMLVSLLGVASFVGVEIHRASRRLDAAVFGVPEAPLTDMQYYDLWLENASTINPDESRPIDITLIISSVVADAPHYRTIAYPQDVNTTLGALAQKYYGAEKYWPLIAALNVGTGAFTFRSAGSTTVVKAPTAITLIRPARYERARSLERLWSTRGKDLAFIYATWGSRADAGTPIDNKLLSELDAEAREGELSFGYAIQQRGPPDTLRGLARDIYHDEEQWRLIRWFSLPLYEQPPAWLNDPDLVLSSGARVVIPQLMP